MFPRDLSNGPILFNFLLTCRRRRPEYSFQFDCKHLVHEPLIRRAHIFKAEWHHFITKKTLVGNK